MRDRSRSAAGRSAAPPAAAVPQGCTNLKLMQASRLVARHYDAALAPSGLRRTQYSLLSAVVKLGPLRGVELAAALRLEPSTLSRNLQPLLDKGWVLAEPDPADARGRVYAATAEGRALRAQAQRRWRGAQEALNAALGEAQVAALHALLDDCIARLAGEADPGGAD